jgi:hypothetical protein
MSQERFKANTSDAFADCLYKRVIARDHFLVQLKRVVPWESFTSKLVKGRGVTRIALQHLEVGRLGFGKAPLPIERITGVQLCFRGRVHPSKPDHCGKQ